ncbi:GTPase-activating protein pac-1, partial [Trichinella papuae]
LNICITSTDEHFSKNPPCQCCYYFESKTSGSNSESVCMMTENLNSCSLNNEEEQLLNVEQKEKWENSSTGYCEEEHNNKAVGRLDLACWKRTNDDSVGDAGKQQEEEEEEDAAVDATKDDASLNDSLKLATWKRDLASRSNGLVSSRTVPWCLRRGSVKTGVVSQIVEALRENRKLDENCCCSSSSSSSAQLGCCYATTSAKDNKYYYYANRRFNNSTTTTAAAAAATVAASDSCLVRTLISLYETGTVDRVGPLKLYHAQMYKRELNRITSHNLGQVLRKAKRFDQLLSGPRRHSLDSNQIFDSFVDNYHNSTTTTTTNVNGLTDNQGQIRCRAMSTFLDESFPTNRPDVLTCRLRRQQSFIRAVTGNKLLTSATTTTTTPPLAGRQAALCFTAFALLHHVYLTSYIHIYINNAAQIGELTKILMLLTVVCHGGEHGTRTDLCNRSNCIDPIDMLAFLLALPACIGPDDRWLDNYRLLNMSIHKLLYCCYCLRFANVYAPQLYIDTINEYTDQSSSSVNGAYPADGRSKKQSTNRSMPNGNILSSQAAIQNGRRHSTLKLMDALGKVEVMEKSCLANGNAAIPCSSQTTVPCSARIPVPPGKDQILSPPFVRYRQQGSREKRITRFINFYNSCQDQVDNFTSETCSPSPSCSSSFSDSSCAKPTTLSPCSDSTSRSDTVYREGILYHKQVAVENGRRAHDRSWQLYWAFLIDHRMYLCPEKPMLAVPPTALSFDKVANFVREKAALLIDVRSCIADIAYSHLKRKNVFRCITVNQSEHLFQAMDEKDMIGWIAALQSCAVMEETSEETVSLGELVTVYLTLAWTHFDVFRTICVHLIYHGLLPLSFFSVLADDDDTLHKQHVDFSMRADDWLSVAETVSPSSLALIIKHYERQSHSLSPSVKLKKPTTLHRVVTAAKERNTAAAAAAAATTNASLMDDASHDQQTATDLNRDEASAVVASSSSSSSFGQLAHSKLEKGEATLKKVKKWCKTRKAAAGPATVVSSQVNNPKVNAVFGINLEDCVTTGETDFVPLIVQLCVKVVEAYGLDTVGVYRIPGNTAAVNTLSANLDQGFEFVEFDDIRWRDVNVVSSLLKAFFRKLPDPLLTSAFYRDFIEANRIESLESRLKAFRELIFKLPKHNFETLKFLLQHLKRVVAHSSVNKMEVKNLALMFGPSLVRPSGENMVTMVTHMSDQCKIVELLLSHSDWIFGSDWSASLDNQSEQTKSLDHSSSNVGELLNLIHHSEKDLDKVKENLARNLQNVKMVKSGYLAPSSTAQAIQQQQQCFNTADYDERNIDEEVARAERLHSLSVECCTPSLLNSRRLSAGVGDPLTISARSSTTNELIQAAEDYRKSREEQIYTARRIFIAGTSAVDSVHNSPPVDSVAKIDGLARHCRHLNVNPNSLDVLSPETREKIKQFQRGHPLWSSSSARSSNNVLATTGPQFSSNNDNKNGVNLRQHNDELIAYSESDVRKKNIDDMLMNRSCQARLAYSANSSKSNTPGATVIDTTDRAFNNSNNNSTTYQHGASILAKESYPATSFICGSSISSSGMHDQSRLVESNLSKPISSPAADSSSSSSAFLRRHVIMRRPAQLESVSTNREQNKNVKNLPTSPSTAIINTTTTTPSSSSSCSSRSTILRNYGQSSFDSAMPAKFSHLLKLNNRKSSSPQAGGGNKRRDARRHTLGNVDCGGIVGVKLSSSSIPSTVTAPTRWSIEAVTGMHGGVGASTASVECKARQEDDHALKQRCLKRRSVRRSNPNLSSPPLNFDPALQVHS